MYRTILTAFVAAVLVIASGCRDNPTNPHRFGTITGRVTDAVTGDPVANAVIATAPSTTSVITDANGAFRIGSVTPGAYAVTAIADGYDPGTVQLTVAGGGTAAANIQLQPERGGSTGDALLFDGVDDYGRVPHAQGLNLGGGDISIEAWIRARKFDRWNWVLTKGSSNASLEYLLGVDGRRVSFNVNNTTEDANSSQWHHLIGNTVLNEGEWYHIAGVYNSATRRMQIYVNGRADGAVTIASGPVVTQSPVFIGAREYFGTGRAVELFNGIITDVRLWQIARSDVAIRETMYRRLTGTERGLVGYWPLSEGSGSSISDRTGHGFNGTLHNRPEWVPADLPL